MTKEEQKAELEIVDSLFHKILAGVLHFVYTKDELAILGEMMDQKFNAFDEDVFQEFINNKKQGVSKYPTSEI